MEPHKKPSFFTKVCFSSGEIPGTTSRTFMGLLLLPFLAEGVGIAPVMAGTIFMIGRARDGFTNPFMCPGPLLSILIGLFGAFLLPITFQRYLQIREELDSRKQGSRESPSQFKPHSI